MLPFAIALPAFAAEPILEPVVVTATRTPGVPVNPAADVTVIDSERLDIKAGHSIADVLAQDGGLEIATNGGPASTTGLFIRGTKPAQNVLLIDGFRLTNPTDNSPPIQALPLSAFGQIEVVRGAASGLYGSGAIGGAVQLLSRVREGQPAFETAVTVGRYGTYRGEASYGGTVSDTRFNVALGVDGNQGFSATKPSIGSNFESDKDGYRRQSVVANLRQDLHQGQALRINLMAIDGRTDFDGGIPAGSPRPYTNNQTQLFGATYEFRPSGNWQSEVKAGQTNYAYQYKNAGYDFSPKATSQQFAWLNYFTLPVGKLTAGTEYEKQSVKGEGVNYNVSDREVVSAFGQWLGQIGAHQLQANLRADKWTGFSTQATGGLQYAYAVTPAWSLTASGATAFRVPTFDDLYFPCMPWGCSSNPNLRPEKSRNIDLGTRYKQGADELRIVAFHNRIHDAIELDSNYIPQNVNAAIDGASATWRHNEGGWLWNLAYTYQDARDGDSGIRLVRRARNIATASLERQMGAWRIGSELRAQDGRFSTFDTPSSYMGGYGIAKLYASYAVSKEVTVMARLDNITNKDYELAKGYNTPGRSFFLTLRYSPKP